MSVVSDIDLPAADFVIAKVIGRGKSGQRLRHSFNLLI
jgi:hypothetical protein